MAIAMAMAMEKEGLGLEITELRLGLPGGRGSGSGSGCVDGYSINKNEKKRSFSEIVKDENSSNMERKVPNKNQVVGWPPVCSYRKKNIVQEKRNNDVSKMYVKISMDGTPYMRKVDLNTHKGYADLIIAFEELFGCFGNGGVLMDSDSSEYIPIYEDKDGDWMLVGDVPWEMFMESCKRLRIMKRSNATTFGLRSRITKGSNQGSIATGESRTEWKN